MWRTTAVSGERFPEPALAILRADRQSQRREFRITRLIAHDEPLPFYSEVEPFSGDDGVQHLPRCRLLNAFGDPFAEVTGGSFRPLRAFGVGATAAGMVGPAG